MVYDLLTELPARFSRGPHIMMASGVFERKPRADIIFVGSASQRPYPFDMTIKLICLDADDTLWHNERYFRAAQDRIDELVVVQADAGPQLAEITHENVPIYGFGAKSFVLSAIEAVALSGATVETSKILEILAVGKRLLTQPVELFDGVEQAILQLKERCKVVLVTKGDLLHQEAKIAMSGLAGHLDGINIVSDKTPATFTALFDRYGVEPAQSLVIGDSLRSDILPALAAGAFAAYIPQPLAWSFEVRDEPSDNPRYRRFETLADAVSWVKDTWRGAVGTPS